jgi:hypothetical protein
MFGTLQYAEGTLERLIHIKEGDMLSEDGTNDDESVFSLPCLFNGTQESFWTGRARIQV